MRAGQNFDAANQVAVGFALNMTTSGAQKLALISFLILRCIIEQKVKTIEETFFEMTFTFENILISHFVSTEVSYRVESIRPTLRD